LATAPECYARYCIYSYVEGICEIEVMSESFDVVYGDRVSFGLVGGWWGDFGGALG